MSKHSDPGLSASKQYLTLDLLEGVCTHAREVVGMAYERGESLSNERLFNEALLYLVCTRDQLAEMKEMLEGAIHAANETYQQMTRGRKMDT